MARCGRCGLWAEYPANHPEQKWDGVCVWYQTRLAGDEVWEHRECSDFFERIPGFHVMDHFDYKVKREELGDAYQEAKSARWIAYISMALASATLLSEWMQSM